MRQYCFRDTDASGDAEYDIIADEYEVLLNICVTYCKYLTIRICCNDIVLPARMLAHQTELLPEMKTKYAHYGDANGRIIAFRVYPEIVTDMIGVASSVFSWTSGWGLHNPDDPAFFREDGSAFFYSVVHEGKCVIEQKAGEDIGAIIHDRRWQESSSAV